MLALHSFIARSDAVIGQLVLDYELCFTNLQANKAMP